MTIPEFIDTYSDDILMLTESRIALLTHPFRNEPSDLCNASFARLYAIIMIGSIEAMLEHWKGKDEQEVLSAYFDPKATNGDKIKNLCSAFRAKGFEVDESVFYDYLAIKYIRNAVVHGAWDEKKESWVLSRGFPVDARKLNESHLEKMINVNENLMYYIALTGMRDQQRHVFPKRLLLPLSPLKDSSGITHPAEWPMLFWRNLERINATLISNVAKIRNSVSPNSDTSNFGIPYLNEMWILFQTTKSGTETLPDSVELGKTALRSWREYVRLTDINSIFSRELTKEVLGVLRRIHAEKVFPRDGIYPELHEETPTAARIELVRSCFERTGTLQEHEIAKAHKFGASAWRVARNITPVSLFMVYLPTLVPGNAAEYIAVGRYVSDLFEIGRLWYGMVESRELEPNLLSPYREFSEKVLRET